MYNLLVHEVTCVPTFSHLSPQTACRSEQPVLAPGSNRSKRNERECFKVARGLALTEPRFEARRVITQPSLTSLTLTLRDDISLL